MNIKATESNLGTVRALACIARSNCLPTQPMIAHEQRITIEIQKKLWNRRSVFMLSYLKKISAAQEISYLTIDKGCLSTPSIYTANLRLFSDAKQASFIDPESCIPGIYWTQFISRSMIPDHKIVTLKEACVNMIVEEIGSGLWIQTTNKIQNDSADFHRQLYQTIADCSYPPDKPTLQ